MINDQFHGTFYNNGNFSRVDDVLAVEESLSISINSEPFTVTMRTPGNEEELVRGLLFTEEVYRDTDNDPVIEILETNVKGYTTSLNIKIADDKILKNFAASRNLVSASSCGLCGRTSFEDTVSKNTINESGLLQPAIIASMFEAMSKQQDTFQRSGGTHASAAFTLEGKLLEIREDIGRHNAVDKVIGGLIRNKSLDRAKCLIVSGRISYEIVNKALSAGIPFLASFSAASSLAVEMAQGAGMTIMAFCRNNKLTIYSHPERIIQSTPIQVNI
jgi:FdhD protein